MKRVEDTKRSAPSRLLLLLFALALLLTGCGRRTGEDFGIERAVSPVDFNANGVDDYTDFLLGARADAERAPRYDGAYQESGYPPEDIGVCTDVVWRAFRQAGYALRWMVDRDIADHPERYPLIAERDDKIDFRRVKTLRVFFDTYAVRLTTDVGEIAEWQPGDIVIFGENSHIAVVSDIRNAAGRPYIIHNGGQPRREEDYLGRDTVAAHYRFDASRLPPDLLVPWTGE